MNWIQTLIGWIVSVWEWLVNLFSPPGPNVTTFAPVSGWPGTILEIEGAGFSASRDENGVAIGGTPAIMIAAAPDRLTVMAGEHTTGGPVEVTVGGTTVGSAGPFEVLPYPDPQDPAQSGAPRFFHGPQDGTPKTGVANQPVLVILSYPTDHNPGNASARAKIRNALIGRMDSARDYWDAASYGSTTWNMTYSDWVALPGARREYFWEQGDIDDARRALLLASTRALEFSGSRIRHGVDNGWIPVDHPTPKSLHYLPGHSTAGKRTTALYRRGDILFAGTVAGTIHAFDLTAAGGAAEVGSLTLPGSLITSIAGHGSHLLVAGREGGVLWVDATAPAAMSIVTTFATGDSWAMAADVSGDRGYVGAGDTLQVFDLAGAMPVLVGSFPAGAWVTGVDATALACAVATDGDGVRIFEVTAGGLVERSVDRAVLRVRALTLVGDLVYVAANAAGLRIVDISKLGAPAQLSQLATTKPCFNVVVEKSRAILALGAHDLVSVDVADPKKPAKNTAEHSSPSDPDLTALETALTVALDGQALVKDGDHFYIDALVAWMTATGGSLDPYEGILVIVNGPFVRGQSWLVNGFSFAGDSLTFNHTKGVIYLAQDASRARIAHEIGHWLGMWDIYAEAHANGTFTVGSAAPWCLSGDGDLALFCGHQIHDIMSFYSLAQGNENVVTETWSATGKLDKTFDIAAHDLTEDATSGRIHLLILEVASGLRYYVEVRQTPTGGRFDSTVPIPPATPGVVVVTRVTEGTSISNSFERPIMLFDVLGLGEQAVDAARNLVISVESEVQNRPLVYRVRVRWNQPVTGDPNGAFDLTITPWDTSTWETTDIWIDSPRNNPGGSIEYEFHEPGDPTKPRLNGDRPWVQRKNTIYARVRNTGPQDVSDVYVSCYVTSPPGIGDNGQWATLATQPIPTLSGHGDAVVEFDWTPATGEHSCIKIAILPQMGEIEPNNNIAQENVFTFDSAGGSSHEPVILEAMVRSPFVIWRKVDLIVRDLPIGWHAVVDNGWVWLEGHGARGLRAVIWTDRDSGAAADHEIPPLALPRVEGWTSFDHRYVPIGGILAAVKAVKRVALEVELESGDGFLYVTGCLVPAVADVPVTLEILDEHGATWLLYGKTDSSGCFAIHSGEEGLHLEPGAYTTTVFVTAGGDAAETESEPMKLVVG